ncbi:hypothetical protein HD554DRAFT_2171097 [Boletus coccyginus]|nr:hypothetical protein HD554DRAFT_2171097 [Boletus coccyginus]
MKRGAERQLTKDNSDDEDIEEIQDPQAVQKADESALAKRQIRALPKRALAASRPPSLNGLLPVPAPDVEKVEAPPQPKFGGFVGFGAGNPVSNPFAFAAQPPAVSAPSAFDTAFKPAQAIATSASPFLGEPKLAPMDTDVSPPKPATSPPAEETDAVALKYFKSLRGLNVSFLSAISTAVEKDPFCDVANLVESYKNLRTTIQSEFDGSQSSSTRGPVTTNPAPTFGAKAPPEKTTSLFSMPKPSAGSVEVSPKLPPAGESGTKIGSFTFPPFVPPSGSAPTQLPFGLTSKPSEPSTSSSATTSEPPKSAFAFPASNTSTSTSTLPPTSGFSFAAPSSIANTTSTPVAGSSSQENEGSSASSSARPTSTAPTLGSGSVPNFFATTKSTSPFGTSDAASKPASVFGSSVFGNSSTTESSKSMFNPSPSPSNPDSKDNFKVPTTLFGNATATSSATPASIFRPSPDRPVSSFGSASPPKTSAFAFGKPAGSIGNPVGFTFGGSPSSAGDTTIAGSSSAGFSSFGAPSTKPSESLFSPATTDKSSESTPQPEAEGNEDGGEEEAAKLLPSHAHDEEGEGEEDEVTMHVVRCKVYRLFRSEGKSEWKDLGVGMFRLKKHKETNVRRVLMRNSSTGRILINFRMHGNLKPSLAKNAVSLVGYESSTPASFSVRVKTEEQAKDLKQALEREIAAVQAVE